MFTGIITNLGSVGSVIKTGDWRFIINTSFDTSSIDMGASICCSGVCLTVIETGPDWFAVDVSKETISKTTLGSWKEGTSINLERSLKMGDEMGGHIVSGHVDGVGYLSAKIIEGHSACMTFYASSDLIRFIATKGSVTINGISLTVNVVEDETFKVNVIPHTQAITTLSTLEINDAVNLEIDMLARYVARLIETDK
jgi:riboflavin synthase